MESESHVSEDLLDRVRLHVGGYQYLALGGQKYITMVLANPVYSTDLSPILRTFLLINMIGHRRRVDRQKQGRH